MTDIVLEWNDPRIGTMVGGTPTVWPATDVHGQAYTQVNATILRVSNTAFVVIGPDRGQAIDRVLIAPFALPPVPEPEPIASTVWEDYDLSNVADPPFAIPEAPAVVIDTEEEPHANG